MCIRDSIERAQWLIRDVPKGFAVYSGDDPTAVALILSAIDSAERAVELGLPRERIVLSAKVSGVQELIAVYLSLIHI